MSKNNRVTIAKRAEKELKDGYYVNLGIGMPTMVANHISENKQVVLQSENGLLGIGPYPAKDEVDPDLINEGKEIVTAIKGASFFDNATSFGMIRGGLIDLAIFGGMEVADNGDLASRMLLGKVVKGMGGAMDLVHGDKKNITIIDHTKKDGKPKILKECALPLTGAGVIDQIITERAVINITDEGLELVEIAEGFSLEDVKNSTEPELIISKDLKYDAY